MIGRSTLLAVLGAPEALWWGIQVGPDARIVDRRSNHRAGQRINEKRAAAQSHGPEGGLGVEFLSRGLLSLHDAADRFVTENPSKIPETV